MTRFIMATTAAALLGCGSAFAQVGGMSISPGLGMTSPLGIGPGSPVAPAGTPLGATELAALGLSPMMSGASPMGATTGGATSCSGIGGSMPQTSFGTGGSSMTGASSGTGTSTADMSSIFDGGGMTGTATGACASIGSSSLAGPAAPVPSGGGMGSVSSVGRVGIPLGSSELESAGLAPPSVALTANPLAPLMTLTPLIVMPNSSTPFSTSGTAPPCQLTGTGVPGAGGVTTPFGAPLTGKAFGLAETNCD
jgi:hypothetical protein